MHSNHVLEHFGRSAIRFVFKILYIHRDPSYIVLHAREFRETDFIVACVSKVMRVGLLFHSIRSLEDLQKAFQPEPKIQPEAYVRLENLGN